MRIYYEKHNAVLNNIMLLRIFGICLGMLLSVYAYAINAPISSQAFIPYTAQSKPYVSLLASSSKPIAVGDAADESGALQLQVRTTTFSEDMDAYFGLMAPRSAGDTLLLFTENGSIQPVTAGITAWKRNFRQLDEQLFGELALNLFPGDNYTFFLLVTKAGDNPLNGNFYLWSTSLILTPTFEQISQEFTMLFPDGVDGLMAVLLAIDNGYSVQQVVNGLMVGNILGTGDITTGFSILPPDLDQFGLIVERSGRQLVRSGVDQFLDEFAEASLRSKLIKFEEDLRVLDEIDENKHQASIAILGTILKVAQFGTDKNFTNTIDYDAHIKKIMNAIFLHLAAVREVNDKKIVQLFDGDPENEASKVLQALKSSRGVIRNRVPVPQEQSLFAYLETRTDIVLEAEDPDGDRLDYVIVNGPENGRLSGSDAFLTYTPNTGFSGTDSFTFNVSDGMTISTEATVDIVVKGATLVLDKVILSKYNGNANDLCADSTVNSTEICILTENTSSGRTVTVSNTLQEGVAEYNFSEVRLHDNYILADYTLSFNFDSPPTTITAGETLQSLRIDGQQNGFTTGWFLTRGIVYYYKRGNSNSYFKDTDVYFDNRLMPYNETTGAFEGGDADFDYTVINIPATAGDGFTIGAKLGWDPGLYIDWVYKIKPE